MTAISFAGSPFAFDPIGMTRDQLNTCAEGHRPCTGAPDHRAPTRPPLQRELETAPARTHDDAVDAVGPYFDGRAVIAPFRPVVCKRCGKPDAAHVVKPRRSDGRPYVLCPGARGDPDEVEAAIKAMQIELDARREREILARMKLIAAVRSPV